MYDVDFLLFCVLSFTKRTGKESGRVTEFCTPRRVPRAVVHYIELCVTRNH